MRIELDNDKDVVAGVKDFFAKDRYPEFAFCFKGAALKIAKRKDSKKYRLIELIINPQAESTIRLMENLIRKVRKEILKLSPDGFVRDFGISVKKIAGEYRVFGDIMAEIAVCSELYGYGFSKWKKLPKQKRSPSPDFFAMMDQKRFLIEVKHINQNDNIEETFRDSRFGYKLQEVWDNFSRFVTRGKYLERAIRQLNVKPGFERMLVLAHGRNVISIFGNEEDFKRICVRLKAKIAGSVDHIAFMSLVYEDTYFFSFEYSNDNGK